MKWLDEAGEGKRMDDRMGVCDVIKDRKMSFAAKTKE
jgi:hypothetical protein